MSDLPPQFDPSARPVPDEVLERLQHFAEAWKGKTGIERQLAQGFLLDLCDALGTAKPTHKTLPDEDYCFEKVVQVPGSQQTGRIDLYKKGHFVLEAKCGRDKGDTSSSMPERGSRVYAAYIESAYNDQALLYARLLPEGRPPILVVVDVGARFWIWRRNPDGNYPGFYSPERIEIPLDAVAQEEHARVLLAIFEHPAELDPSRRQAKVTEDVAKLLAELARPLQARHEPAKVAAFLIRSLFCLFAEDVDLLPSGSFSRILGAASTRPEVFRPAAEQLFAAMRDGGLVNLETIRKFNGALFSDTSAIDLTKEEVALLEQAASKNWALVEPSIFGTLIERALDPRKRKRLGAHYTPRSFVERLVRPTLEQPLRREWDLKVRAEARALWDEAEAAEVERRAITALDAASRESARKLSDRARKLKDEALALIDAFHGQLIGLRVLDPACGTGNFLYVSYALLKELEFEVLAFRRQLAPEEVQLGLTGGATGIGAVAPSQFLGIEVEGFAAEIAQLVLWIGHLQWELRHRLRPEHIPIPILPPVRTIEHRDALLVPGRAVPRLDAAGQPVTRWIWGSYVDADTHDGQVPDPTAREPLVDYPDAAEATWPRADFIVGNPPFIGNKVMRERLGDGYVEALRRVYREVPDTVDFVMYWWHKAAEKARAGEVRRFGFITTNSISQTFNRKVLELHMQAESPVRLVMAVPDHPWVDDGAAVRISMTAAEPAPEGGGDGVAVLEVVAEGESSEDLAVLSRKVTVLHADLSYGADVTSSRPLLANKGLCAHGPNPYGDGFRLSPDDVVSLGFDVEELPYVVRPYLTARDLTQGRPGRFTIDAFGLTAEELLGRFPTCHQWLLDRVKPQRDEMRDPKTRRDWWLFGRPREELRPLLVGLGRYIVTPETSRHRVYQWIDERVLADHTTLCIPLNDDWKIGVLDGRFHTLWATATGVNHQRTPNARGSPTSYVAGHALALTQRRRRPARVPACRPRA